MSNHILNILNLRPAKHLVMQKFIMEMPAQAWQILACYTASIARVKRRWKRSASHDARRCA